MTTDPVVIASHIVTALQSIVSRNVPPMESAVVSVADIHGGTAFNIIPPDVRMRGTVRTFSAEVADLVRKRFREIVTGVSKSMGGESVIDYVIKLPATVNTPAVASFARKIAAGIVGAENVASPKPSMGGEDFSLFLNEFPGAYCFIGSNNPKKGATYAHHHPCFNVDEAQFKVGMELAIRFVREWG